MTREEAIEKLKLPNDLVWEVAGESSEEVIVRDAADRIRLVDRLVALGLLKLDEPAKGPKRAAAHHALYCALDDAGIHASQVLDIIRDYGLKVIYANES